MAAAINRNGQLPGIPLDGEPKKGHRRGGRGTCGSQVMMVRREVPLGAAKFFGGAKREKSTRGLERDLARSDFYVTTECALRVEAGSGEVVFPDNCRLASPSEVDAVHREEMRLKQEEERGQEELLKTQQKTQSRCARFFSCCRSAAE